MCVIVSARWPIRKPSNSRAVSARICTYEAHPQTRPVSAARLKINAIRGNPRSTQRWKDVPRGTMDEMSSHVRLDLLSVKSPRRQLDRPRRKSAIRRHSGDVANSHHIYGAHVCRWGLSQHPKQSLS
jgi:hypothetical protein